MAKLVLGKTPENFKAFPVKFTLPDGVEDQIQVTFKYKTRSQFAAFLNDLFLLNDLFKRSGDDTAPTEDGVDFEALFAKGGAQTVAHLSQIIVAWDLDEPINAKTLADLHDQVPNAAAAMTKAYSVACTEGRLGN